MTMSTEQAEKYADDNDFYFVETFNGGWELFRDPPTWASWYHQQPETPGSAT